MRYGISTAYLCPGRGRKTVWNVNIRSHGNRKRKNGRRSYTHTYRRHSRVKFPRCLTNLNRTEQKLRIFIIKQDNYCGHEKHSAWWSRDRGRHEKPSISRERKCRKSSGGGYDGHDTPNDSHQQSSGVPGTLVTVGGKRRAAAVLQGWRRRRPESAPELCSYVTAIIVKIIHESWRWQPTVFAATAVRTTHIIYDSAGTTVNYCQIIKLRFVSSSS